MDVIELTKTLVGIDSSPVGGTWTIANRIHEIGKALGFEVISDDCECYSERQANILLIPKTAKDKKWVVFQSHIDTVDPGSYSLWKNNDMNPFNAVIDSQRIWGLGVASSKADLAAKMLSVSQWNENKSALAPVVLATWGGERIEMGGAKKSAVWLTEKAEKMLVGFPTQMKPMTSFGGLLVFDVSIPFQKEELSFRKAHDKEESTSAQSKVFTMKLDEDGRRQPALVQLFEYAKNLPDQLAVLSLDGGMSHNIDSQEALIEVDLSKGFQSNVLKRTVDAVQSIKKILSNSMNGLPSDWRLNLGFVKTKSQGIQLGFSIRFEHSTQLSVIDQIEEELISLTQSDTFEFQRIHRLDPFTLPEKGILEEWIKKENTLDGEVHSTNESNEAFVYRSYLPEVTVIGPGHGIGNTYSSSESVELSQIKMASELYSHLISRILL